MRKSGDMINWFVKGNNIDVAENINGTLQPGGMSDEGVV